MVADYLLQLLSSSRHIKEWTKGQKEKDQLELYRYGILACTDIRYGYHQKKLITDSRSDICITTKVIVNLCKSVQLPTPQHVDIFIDHSMPVVIVA